MPVDVIQLKFPVDICICGFDLRNKTTMDFKDGKGFCLRCGFPYVMVEKEQSKAIEQLDWNDLQKLKVELGIKGQLKRPELVEAIKEAQNALEKRGQASL